MTINAYSRDLRPVRDPEVVFGVVNSWNAYVAKTDEMHRTAQRKEVMRLVEEKHALIEQQFKEGATLNRLAQTWQLNPGDITRILRARGVDV